MLAPLAVTEQRSLVRCNYFDLSLVVSKDQPVLLDTQAESFHALTVIEGKVDVQCGEELVILDRFETVVVSADAGAYRLTPQAPCRVLMASVPPN